MSGPGIELGRNVVVLFHTANHNGIADQNLVVFDENTIDLVGARGKKGFKFAAAICGYLVDRCIPVAGYKKAAFRGDCQIVETGRELGEFLPLLSIQAEPEHCSAKLREISHLVWSHLQGDGGGKFFSDYCNIACIR